jgi:tRNA 2-thiouridine synthesizing protein A
MRAFYRDSLGSTGNTCMADLGSIGIRDARGLVCPEPVLRTAKAMRSVDPGETLTVLATDPVASIDFPYYCHHAGLELLSTTSVAEVLIFKIRKPRTPVQLASNRPIG